LVRVDNIYNCVSTMKRLASSTQYLTRSRPIELFITLIVSCVPASTAYWKNFLRGSSFIVTLRSVFNLSHTSFFSRPSATSSLPAPGSSESATNLQGQYELGRVPEDGPDARAQLYSTKSGHQHHIMGITKSVELDQKSVSGSL